VINRKAPEGAYVTSWEEFELLPEALEGLRVLAELDAPVVVVTNQRGVARGRMTEADLADIHERMRAAVAQAGGRIDAIYHCPHEGGCDCRKPATGLFERAARELGVDLAASAVVGTLGAAGLTLGAGAALPHHALADALRHLLTIGMLTSVVVAMKSKVHAPSVSSRLATKMMPRCTG